MSNTIVDLTPDERKAMQRRAAEITAKGYVGPRAYGWCVTMSDGSTFAVTPKYYPDPEPFHLHHLVCSCRIGRDCLHVHAAWLYRRAEGAAIRWLAEGGMSGALRRWRQQAAWNGTTPFRRDCFQVLRQAIIRLEERGPETPERVAGCTDLHGRGPDRGPVYLYVGPLTGGDLALCYGCAAEEGYDLECIEQAPCGTRCAICHYQ